MESSPLLLQYCIRVIFQESFNILPIETIRCLSLVSRDIHTIIKPYIEDNYWFDLYKGRELGITHYQPKNIEQVQSADRITHSVKKIRFIYYFDNIFDLTLFHNITHIEFEIYFNQPISIHNLPPNLTHLKLGWNFNLPVDQLPQKLKKVEMGYNFNNFINKLPDSIEELRLGFLYNKPIERFPLNLKLLSFSHYFNRPLVYLPPKVVRVEFQSNVPHFNQPISHLNPNIKFEIVDLYNNAKPYQYKPN